MAGEQYWYQVFRLRNWERQTPNGLLSIMPLLADYNEHPQWLGTGYYFWKNRKDAVDWATYRYKCRESELVVGKFVIPELRLDEIFDFQNDSDHYEMVTNALTLVDEWVLSNPNIEINKSYNEEDYICEAVQFLSEQGELSEMGFKAIKYSERKIVESGSVPVKMSPRTKAIFEQRKLQICLLKEYRHLAVLVR